MVLLSWLDVFAPLRCGRTAHRLRSLAVGGLPHLLGDVFHGFRKVINVYPFTLIRSGFSVPMPFATTEKTQRLLKLLVFLLSVDHGRNFVYLFTVSCALLAMVI